MRKDMESRDDGGAGKTGAGENDRRGKRAETEETAREEPLYF